MFKKWFKKNESTTEHEYQELELHNLGLGDLFDFDLTTWEVVSSAESDYDGHIESELEVKGGVDNRTLVVIPDGGDWNYQWLQEKTLIELGLNNVQNDLKSEKEPEENLTIEGTDYVGYESGGGMFKGNNEEKPFLYWSYENDNDQVLNIIQWGDNEFSATIGVRVAEFQFSNILPGSGR